MINKINRLNFSAISSKLNEKNINNNTEIPEINNKANFQRLINDFKTSYRTNRYWGNSGNYNVSLPEKSMTIEEQLEKPILDNIDYNIFGVRPQLSISFTKSNITSGNFNCLTIIGSTVIAGSYSHKGLYYSEDNGKTWNHSNIYNSNFSCLTVIGSTVIAGSGSTAGADKKGLYYSEDNGHTWKSTNITSGNNFSCLTVIGSTVIAGSETNGGLYYSEDNGHTWQLSNITSGGFRCLTVIGSTVISGSSFRTGSDSNLGLIYTESISEPLEFKEEREDALKFLNSSDPKNDQLIYNSILSKLFLDWLDYTLVKDCSINKNYTKYKDEAIVKESIDNNILTNNKIVYGNGPYFKFTEKYSC